MYTHYCTAVLALRCTFWLNNSPHLPVGMEWNQTGPDDWESDWRNGHCDAPTAKYQVLTSIYTTDTD